MVSMVVIHPLVLLSVCDHYNRVSNVRKVPRVVGLLLGSKRADKSLDVANSFASQFLAVDFVFYVKKYKLQNIVKKSQKNQLNYKTKRFKYYSLAQQSLRYKKLSSNRYRYEIVCKEHLKSGK
jgi:hypothetical protein